MEGVAVNRILISLLMLTVPHGASAEDPPVVLVVVGAEGTEEYGKQFREWAGRWSAAAEKGRAKFISIGLEVVSEKSDRDLLREKLSAEPVDGESPLWLVLIGHGTFNGKTAKFNLRGPDVMAAEMKDWLKPFKRPTAIIDCTSTSGAFLAELSAHNRVVITATKSGHEYNFARFGDYLSASIGDPKADLDKDEQTSLLEAFLVASARVREFYARDARLATEHSLIDDNGDRLGTPADWFQGLRPSKSAKDGASVDGVLARQIVLIRSDREDRLPVEIRARRDALERDLANLRQRKSTVAESEYLTLLEPLLVELARLYEP